MDHHAYYIEGSSAGYELPATPLHESHERFGIDEARALISIASLKNYEETVFLLEVSSITSEAQQALLKLFEEPQPGTTFILVAPHGALLPTLKSRMLEFPKASSQKNPSASREAFAETFLQSPQKERSAMIADLLKDEEGAKTRVREFLLGLETLLAPKLATSAQVREGLEDIAKVRSYVNDRSPSLKMLLEHLAISLPRVSLS